MIGFEKKEQIEMSVLGSFLEFPSVSLRLIDKLKVECFSSDGRQELFRYIRDEKIDGKMLMIGTITEESLLEEAKQCFGKGHLFNLKAHVDSLIAEADLNELYRMSDEVKDMITNDKPLGKVKDFIKRKLSKIGVIKDEFTQTMKEAITDIKEDLVSHVEYYIDWPSIDKYMPVTSQGITIIAGNEGTFKTKLMIFMMRSLLFRYDNISVLWMSMEDPSDKLIRGFVSQEEFLTDNELRQIDYKKLIPKDVSLYDINFVTKSQTIEEIGTAFNEFREQREDKFCILIVDNLMKIVPMDKRADPDMEIVREIESWNVKTSRKEASVYLLHHFTKSVSDDKNKDYAYTPKIGHMRGSGRYKDMVTQAILVNPMYSYRDVVEQFKGYEKFIEKLYIVDIAKNRNSNKATMRMLAWPSFNIFKEI